MKKKFGTKTYKNIRKKILILSEILVLFLFIGSLVATIAAGSSEGMRVPERVLAQENSKLTDSQGNALFTRLEDSMSDSVKNFRSKPADLTNPSRISDVNANFPSSYDLRTINKVTPVKDQLENGVCWAFATYASLESDLMPKENWDFSENHMTNILSSAAPEGFDLNSDDGSGTLLMSTAYLTRWEGPVNESDDPYKSPSVYSPTELGLTVRKHVQDVYCLSSRQGPLDNDEIKLAIQNYGAVATVMHMDEDPANSYYNPTTYGYYYDGTPNSNHGVVIVGWDDSFNRNKFSKIPPGNGAFIVKNSWGTGWGENGYFYVSYYDSNIGAGNVVFTAENADNFQNIYQYDPLGLTNNIGYENNPTTGWCANVFTAKSDEVLKAVSFYSLNSSCNYEVEIYTDPESGPINQAGSVLTQSGTIPTAGYHTIHLNNGVQLHALQKFSVVLRLTTPQSNLPIALEKPIPDYSSKAKANAGESFVSRDGTDWTDITTVYPNANVCIKAFTISGSWLPVANFSSNVTGGYVPMSVQFIDHSQNANAWNWDFGDGTISTAQNPTHTFSAAGNYTVILTASNENGTRSKRGVINVALAQPGSHVGPYAYITNSLSNTTSVIDTATNKVIAAVPVGEWPYGVAVTPDGKKAYVSNAASNTTSVIDTATYNVIATVPVGTNPDGVAVNPDGSSVYVTNRDSDNVSVIDTATNNVMGTVKVEEGPLGVAVTPDGKKAYVTNLLNNTTSIIDTATNTVLASVSVGIEPGGVAVSPDGKKAYVVNAGSNTISVIDVATNDIAATMPIGTDPFGVAINPDGTKIYVTNWNSDVNGIGNVFVIDSATNAILASVPVGIGPLGVAVTPDGSKVYVSNFGSNTTSVIDTATNAVTDTIPVGGSPVAFGEFIGPAKTQPLLPVAQFTINITSGTAPFSVQFTDNSQNAIAWNWDFGDGTSSIDRNPSHIYTAAGNYTVNLTASNGYGTNSTTAVITVSPPQSDSHVGPYAYITNSKSNTTSVIDTSTNTVIATVPVGKNPQGVTITPDGKKVYITNSDDNTTSVIDTASNNVVAVVPVGYYPLGVAVSSDGTKVYVTNNGDNTTSVIDTTSNTVTATVPVGIHPMTVAVNPKVGKAYVTNKGSYPNYYGTISVIDTAKNTLTATVNIGKDLGEVAVTPDGTKVFVTDNNNNTTSVIDTTTNSVIAIVPVGTNPIGVAVNPLGSKAYVTNEGSYPNYADTISVIDIASNTVAATVKVESEPIGVAVTPNGSKVYVANYMNSTISVIDTATNNVTASVSVGKGPVALGMFIGPIMGGSSSSNGNGGSGGGGGSSSSSSSGGGGGGGGGSPELQSNVEAKEISQAFISSGKSIKFDFPQKVTPVEYVSFDSKKTTGKTTTIVEMLKGKSSLVSELPSEEVYKSLNIWVGNGGFGDSNNIENSVVCFKVGKSWIQNKNIDKSSITLNRYSDKKWNALSTSQSGEDDKYLYFTAQTPGFSSFVITGKNISSGNEKNPQLKIIGSEQNASAEKIGGQKPDENKDTKLSGFEMIFGIACLLAVFLCRGK